MNKSKEYHLPSGSYWCCSSRYNGLSQACRFGTTFRLSNVSPKQLTNTKISSSITKRLN
jgi:hypothetical protein